MSGRSIDISEGAITQWPGELTVYRKSAPFKASWGATVDLLDRELWAVNAKAVVLQHAIRREDLRLDGRMRAGAQRQHPGVILSFTSSTIGKVRFACDRFSKWQDNVRAIALGMEALRKVDRYGITSDGEQYAGFRAIEAAESARPFETPEQAAKFIAHHSAPEAGEARVEALAEIILDDPTFAESFYRKAATNLHPDRGGSDAAMARLNAARAMLDEVSTP